MTSCDVAVVGGGVVGAAIAYGLARAGAAVTVIDEGDVALRASRGNFGLVWVQGKGLDFTPYAHWTRRAAELWPDFAAELQDETGVDLAYQRPGGLEICLSDQELADRVDQLGRLKAQMADDYAYEILDVTALRDLVPEVSGQVAGASYGPSDGHVNPLYLLRALHAGLARHDGRYLPWGPVRQIDRTADHFRLTASGGTLAAGKVVLAAGLGNRDLAPQLDLAAPVEPIRGQVLITERVRPFLKLPSVLLRQTAEGSIQIGDSHEHVGLDEGTTTGVMKSIAQRAIATFPLLAAVKIVRAWGALRIVTPDGAPVYDRAADGAFAAACHSGITLASCHARLLPGWILDQNALPEIAPLSAGRFDVPAPA